MFKFLVGFLCVIAIESKQIYRLQNFVKPSHYNITLKPDFETDNFDGWVQIQIEVSTDQSNITLHSASLDIKSVFLDKDIANFTLNDEFQTISIFPSDEERLVKEGSHDIHISYKGRLTFEETRGLRKATYEQNGEQGYLLVSDFEPTGARYAFPCFDEPHFKAIFKVHLISSNSSFVGLSNMEVINTSYDNDTGETDYEFADSVVMSTYLVCFVFTDFPYEEQIADINGRQITIRVYSKEPDHSTPLNISARALEFYTNYTNIDYPINKLDLIEYNKRIAGTENWGIVTVRQGVLSLSMKLFDEWQMNHLLSHELGHFWFGNLVTNKWWDDLWLQEGLVTYLTFKASGSVSGEDYESGIPYDYYSSDSAKESLLNRSVVHDVTNEHDLSDIFSKITYNKGANIFKMIEDVLHPENFKLVLRKYLLKYKYETASTKDLISIIEAINPQINWHDFIGQYISQTSYPLINIRRDNESYVLSQSPWCKNSNKEKYEGNRWTIPVTYSTDKNKTSTLVWYNREMDELFIPALDSNVIILNKGHKGLYRYNYEDDLWDSIIARVEALDDDEQKAIMREADLLYNSQHTNCSVIIRLIEKIKPHNRSWVNFIFEAKYLENYDKEASEIFSKYINQCQSKRNGKKISQRFYYKPEEKLENPSRLLTCIKWIKEELVNYIDNDNYTEEQKLNNV